MKRVYSSKKNYKIKRLASYPCFLANGSKRLAKMISHWAGSVLPHRWPTFRWQIKAHTQERDAAKNLVFAPTAKRACSGKTATILSREPKSRNILDTANRKKLPEIWRHLGLRNITHGYVSIEAHHLSYAIICDGYSNPPPPPAGRLAGDSRAVRARTLERSYQLRKLAPDL
jgi:hypothetical protein